MEMETDQNPGQVPGQVPAVDARQKCILVAAFDAFRAYGFRRTSMEDIARGAGMSRAALYLHYRNKEDIFRSLGQYYYDTAEAAVSVALAPARPVAEALEAAFRAQGGELFEALLNSPHGEELLDIKHAHAADLAQAGEARLARIYGDWLAAEAAAGRVRLAGDAQAQAETMLAALHGLKTGTPDYATYRLRADLLAALFGRALAV